VTGGIFLLLAALLMQRVEDPQDVAEPQPAKIKVATSF